MMIPLIIFLVYMILCCIVLVFSCEEDDFKECLIATAITSQPFFVIFFCVRKDFMLKMISSIPVFLLIIYLLDVILYSFTKKNRKIQIITAFILYIVISFLWNHVDAFHDFILNDLKLILLNIKKIITVQDEIPKTPILVFVIADLIISSIFYIASIIREKEWQDGSKESIFQSLISFIALNVLFISIKEKLNFSVCLLLISLGIITCIYREIKCGKTFYKIISVIIRFLPLYFIDAYVYIFIYKHLFIGVKYLISYLLLIAIGYFFVTGLTDGGGSTDSGRRRTYQDFEIDCGKDYVNDPLYGRCTVDDDGTMYDETGYKVGELNRIDPILGKDKDGHIYEIHNKYFNSDDD